MKRNSVLVILVAIMVGAFLLNANRNSDMTLINARAIPLDGQNNRFVVTFEIQNDGSAKTLTGLHSASAQMVHVMNPGYEDAAIVIPANSRGIFAMDGAHIMLMGADEDFVQGASLPLTLTFENTPDVTARELNVGDDTGMGDMAHDMSKGIQSAQSPTIKMDTKNG